MRNIQILIVLQSKSVNNVYILLQLKSPIDHFVLTGLHV